MIGYKVGIYTAAARANYHIDRQVVGILRRGMIVPEGRPIRIGFAFAPTAEADFLLVVRDAGINRARSREEAYRHIRGYRPFIELPDNHYPSPVAADIGRVAALDINARSGVMGAEVALPPTAAGLAALTALSVKAVIMAPSGTSEVSARAVEVWAIRNRPVGTQPPSRGRYSAQAGRHYQPRHADSATRACRRRNLYRPL